MFMFGKYILTITAKQKNGKRHISRRSDNLEYLEKFAQNLNHKRYRVEIYSGNWKFLKEV